MNVDKVGLFDMDGSLADFEHGMRTGLEFMRSEIEPPLPEDLWMFDGDPVMEARMDAIKRRPGWWRELRRIEDGFLILRTAAEVGYRINILTKGPSSQPLAWAEKLEWCNQQPELDGCDVHITMNKSLVYGTFLYDDYLPYMNAWLKHRPRGLGIMPVTTSNRDYHHPQVVKWDGTNLDEVKRALEVAFVRGPREQLVIGGA